MENAYLPSSSMTDKNLLDSHVPTLFAMILFYEHRLLSGFGISIVLLYIIITGISALFTSKIATFNYAPEMESAL